MEPSLRRGTAAGGHGPQELVTTTDGAVHILQGGKQEVVMTPLVRPFSLFTWLG